ncbi:MAG: ABC1 kinase family protein [Gemmataceae bacterium]
MNFTDLPRFARNLNRLREILTVLSKYGLADWLSRHPDIHFTSVLKSKMPERLTNASHPARIRMALAELGPTFIKIGQILSTRPDLVGPELAQALAALQEDAPVDPPKIVRQTIERELGEPVEQLFASFDDVPLASASIGQVHHATLTTGEEVVIKVQHPGIEDKIRTDLDIFVGLAEVAEQLLPELRRYRPRETASEFQRTIIRELDFGREERNLVQFAANFAKNTDVCFPRPCPEHSSSRVLTMEFLEGTKVSAAARLTEQHFDLQDVARRGANIYLDMIFRDGFYHADPHPGNVLVLTDGRIGMLDCGMVGRLDDATRDRIEDLLLAITQRDAGKLTAIITQIGSTPPKLDEAALAADVADFIAFHGSRPLEEFEIGKALTDMTAIIRRFEIVLPANIALLIKVLIMLEGTSKHLNPTFNLTELMVVYQRKIMRRRLSPGRYFSKVKRLYQEWMYLGEIFPRSLANIMHQAQKGRLDIHLSHRRLEPAVNRLVAGLLASSFFVGASLMLAMKVPPVLGGLSVLGLLSGGFSVMVAFRLYLAIRKSGHLDQKDDA